MVLECPSCHVLMIKHPPDTLINVKFVVGILNDAIRTIFVGQWLALRIVLFKRQFHNIIVLLAVFRLSGYFQAIIPAKIQDFGFYQLSVTFSYRCLCVGVVDIGVIDGLGDVKALEVFEHHKIGAVSLWLWRCCQ